MHYHSTRLEKTRKTCDSTKIRIEQMPIQVYTVTISMLEVNSATRPFRERDEYKFSRSATSL